MDRNSNEAEKFWRAEAAAAYAERKQSAAKVYSETGTIQPWMWYSLAKRDLPDTGGAS